MDKRTDTERALDNFTETLVEIIYKELEEQSKTALLEKIKDN